MTRRSVIAMAASVCLVGCGGGSTPENPAAKALQDWAKSLRDRDVRSFCAKTFPSTELPPSLARRLGVPVGDPGTPSAWDRQYQDCLRGFGKHGEFATLHDTRVVVKGVRVGPPVAGAGGITRTATAPVMVKSGDRAVRPFTYRLVEFRGDWKVVFIVD